MLTTLPVLEHAALTDVGRVRLANEDAYHCDERFGLFVVSDGLGGRPSGEAASQIIARSFGHVIKRKLRRMKEINGLVLKQLLSDVTVEISTRMHRASSDIDALLGMGATLAVVLVDVATAYVLHVGDSRVYLARNGRVHRLTEDHFRIGLAAANPQAEGGDSSLHIELIERRMLTQFIGSDRPLNPAVKVYSVQPGDRFLLCSDGLTDPLSDEQVSRLLVNGGSLMSLCQTLVNAANDAGGPDNITSVIVEYKGVQEVSRDELRVEVENVQPPIGIAELFHARLLELLKDLDWLLAGARDAGQMNHRKAMAAIKERMGEAWFTEATTARPSAEPPALFHAAVATPSSPWRQRYESHHAKMAHHLNTLTAGGVRLSPILTGEETALILTTLWRDWRRVEKRYFDMCKEGDFSKQGVLYYLIEHMFSSARTLIGLMEFFPRFMRTGVKSKR